MTGAQIPHMRIVVGVSAFVLVGFLGVSIYILGWSDDKVTQGNIVGTWVNFAVLAVGFWIGSSSGGKSKDAEAPTGKQGDPVHTTEEDEPK